MLIQQTKIHQGDPVMITVYSNPDCVQCETTKRFLSQHNLEFESKMIADSPEIQNLIQEKGYTSAPVVVTDNDSWSGFRITKLHKLIQAS
jgi:glutaredoxin-like protein NrdH